MTETQRTALLQLARSSVMERLGTGELTELFPDPLWSEARGVFVTLHALGRLRGCIGYIEAVEPLGQAVRTMACQAAFHDRDSDQ